MNWQKDLETFSKQDSWEIGKLPHKVEFEVKIKGFRRFKGDE